MSKIDVIIYERNVAVQAVTTQYAEEFVGKTDKLEAIDALGLNNDRSKELLKILAVPYTLIIAPRKEAKSKLRVIGEHLCCVGLGIASKQGIEANVEKFKLWKTLCGKSSAWVLYQTCLQLGAELLGYKDLLPAAGITFMEVEKFLVQTDDFGKLIESIKIQLQNRKSSRKELKSLYSANSNLMKTQLDTYIILVIESNPALYRDYWIARKLPSKAAKKAGETAALASISGTAFNSVTGHVVENAVVEIVALKLIVMSDVHGRYVLTNVPNGEQTVTCHAAGYKIPQAVKVTIANSANQEINFSLVPEGA